MGLHTGSGNWVKTGDYICICGCDGKVSMAWWAQASELKLIFYQTSKCASSQFWQATL